MFFSSALNHSDRIIRPLEIVLKNSFISPRPEKPVYRRESCSPTIFVRTNVVLVEIDENPFPARE